MSNPDMAEIERRVIEASNKGPDDSVKNLQADLMKATQRPAAARMTVENVREAFTYAPWDQEQVDAGKQVTEALIAAAETILHVVPESPLRTRAINGLFDARMIANAAITHRGKF